MGLSKFSRRSRNLRPVLSSSQPLSPKLSPSTTQLPTVDTGNVSRLISPRYGVSWDGERKQRSFRSPTMQMKQELLGMVKELRQTEDSPSIKSVHSLSSLVSTLSQEPGYYQSEMQLISQTLNKVIYCPKSSVPESIWQYISARDVEVVVDSVGWIPYCHLTNYLLSYIEIMWKKDKHYKEIIKETEEKFADLMKMKDEEIEKYQEKIEKMAGNQQPIQLELKRVVSEVRCM